MLMSLHVGETAGQDEKKMSNSNANRKDSDDGNIRPHLNEGGITYLNLKKNTFNDDCTHLLQILTPLTLERFNNMCFKDNAPYSFKHWMELLGRKDVVLGQWDRTTVSSSRVLSYTLPGGAWLSKTSDVKITAKQTYTYDS
jgi:hypothetical protein